MHEVKIEAAHVAEGEEMIVPLLRGGGGDRDFLRPGAAAGDQLARPSKRFKGLVAWARARLPADFRVLRRRIDDGNAELAHPGGNMPGTGDPSHLGLAGERREKRTPDGGHFGAAMDSDAAEKRAGMRDVW